MIPNVNELNGGPLLLNLRQRPQAMAVLHPAGEHTHVEGTVRLHRTPLGTLLAATLRGLPETAGSCPALFVLRGETACPEFAALPGSNGFAWGNLLLGGRSTEELVGQKLCVMQGDTVLAEGSICAIQPYGPWQEEPLPEAEEISGEEDTTPQTERNGMAPEKVAEEKESTAEERVAERVTAAAEETMLPPADELASGDEALLFSVITKEMAAVDSHETENVIE